MPPFLLQCTRHPLLCCGYQNWTSKILGIGSHHIPQPMSTPTCEENIHHTDHLCRISTCCKVIGQMRLAVFGHMKSLLAKTVPICSALGCQSLFNIFLQDRVYDLSSVASKPLQVSQGLQNLISGAILQMLLLDQTCAKETAYCCTFTKVDIRHC